jgi:hypothetical protein
MVARGGLEMPWLWREFLGSMQVNHQTALALWRGLTKAAHPKAKALVYDRHSAQRL